MDSAAMAAGRHASCPLRDCPYAIAPVTSPRLSWTATVTLTDVPSPSVGDHGETSDEVKPNGWTDEIGGRTDDESQEPQRLPRAAHGLPARVSPAKPLRHGADAQRGRDRRAWRAAHARDACGRGLRPILVARC